MYYNISSAVPTFAFVYFNGPASENLRQPNAAILKFLSVNGGARQLHLSQRDIQLYSKYFQLKIGKKYKFCHFLIYSLYSQQSYGFNKYNKGKSKVILKTVITNITGLFSLFPKDLLTTFQRKQKDENSSNKLPSDTVLKKKLFLNFGGSKEDATRSRFYTEIYTEKSSSRIGRVL